MARHNDELLPDPGLRRRKLSGDELADLASWPEEYIALHNVERAKLRRSGSTPKEAEAIAYSLVQAAYRLDDEGVVEHIRAERAGVTFRDWQPLCGHCGRLQHEGYCVRGDVLGLVSTQALVALDEQPHTNSPADISGPLGGWRAA